MIQTIGFCEFCDAFRDMGRNENFSYEGKRILFDFLENWEDGTGRPVELDVIALCCEYDEACWEDIADNYRIDLSECEDDDEKEQAVMEYLNENTLVCGSSVNGIVYQIF